jgi:Lon protease-like protein
MDTERLPLFPLNTVLFPGMVLPLHIFEDRYKLLMQRILEGDRRFGALLIRDGYEVGPVAEPYEVGTVAEVTAVARLEDGCMNISTTGSRRFRAVRLYRDQPYLTGDIEYLPEQYTRSEKLLELQEDVERLSHDYVTMTLTLTDEQRRHVQFPRDPLILSYKVAGLLVAIQPGEAQELLASPTLEHRLFCEAMLLRRELTILRRIGEITEQGGRFSPN